jgi:hypothetical protein
MAINFDDPNVVMNGGQRIPIDTQAEYDAAWNATQQIYSAVGMTAGSAELNDMENRIRAGQTLDQLVANTRDEAQRRAASKQTAQQPDSQANIGNTYQTSAAQAQQVYTAAGISAATVAAAAVPSRELATSVSPRNVLGTQTVRTANSGPAMGMYGGGPAYAGAMPSGGSNMGMLLLLAGGGVIAFLLLRRFL